MSHRPYELVVFDWDGTLIDSVGTIVACTRAAFARLGREMPEEAAVRGAIGLGLEESVAKFSPETGPEFLERLAQAYRECWIEEYHAHPRPFETTVPLLEELRDGGYLLAVATAKSRRGLVRDFDRTALEPYFHASRTADESGSKPAPTMLLELMEELGRTPEETVMIGDTVHDLEMAANAGVDAVAVCSGAAARPELEEVSPVACLENIAGLRPWLLEPLAPGDPGGGSPDERETQGTGPSAGLG